MSENKFSNELTALLESECLSMTAGDFLECMVAALGGVSFIEYPQHIRKETVIAHLRVLKDMAVLHEQGSFDFLKPKLRLVK